jgi:hypothetical protein
MADQPATGGLRGALLPARFISVCGRGMDTPSLLAAVISCAAAWSSSVEPTEPEPCCRVRLCLARVLAACHCMIVRHLPCVPQPLTSPHSSSSFILRPCVPLQRWADIREGCACVRQCPAVGALAQRDTKGSLSLSTRRFRDNIDICPNTAGPAALRPQRPFNLDCFEYAPPATDVDVVGFATRSARALVELWLLIRRRSALSRARGGTRRLEHRHAYTSTGKADAHRDA